MKIENKPFAEWLENEVKDLFDDDYPPKAIALCVRTEDGDVSSAYWNARMDDLLLFEGELQHDVICRVVKDMQEEQEGEDDGN